MIAQPYWYAFIVHATALAVTLAAAERGSYVSIAWYSNRDRERARERERGRGVFIEKGNPIHAVRPPR